MQFFGRPCRLGGQDEEQEYRKNSLLLDSGDCRDLSIGERLFRASKSSGMECFSDSYMDKIWDRVGHQHHPAFVCFQTKELKLKKAPRLGFPSLGAFIIPYLEPGLGLFFIEQSAV